LITLVKLINEKYPLSFKPLASSKKYISSSKKDPFNQLGSFEKIRILIMVVATVSSPPFFFLLFHCSCSSLLKRTKNEAREGNSLPFSCCYVTLCMVHGYMSKENTRRALVGTHPSLLLLHFPLNNEDHTWGGEPSLPSFQALLINNRSSGAWNTLHFWKW
jgi:hypothetical protein